MYIYVFIYVCVYIYIIPLDDSPRPIQTHYFNSFRGLLGVQGPLRHAEYHCVKFSLWEAPYSPRNDRF